MAYGLKACSCHPLNEHGTIHELPQLFFKLLEILISKILFVFLLYKSCEISWPSYVPFWRYEIVCNYGNHKLILHLTHRIMRIDGSKIQN